MIKVELLTERSFPEISYFKVNLIISYFSIKDIYTIDIKEEPISWNNCSDVACTEDKCESQELASQRVIVISSDEVSIIV